MAMPELMLTLENGNHFHMCFGLVLVENFEPVLNWLSILCLDRGEVALWSFYFFAHQEKLLLKSKTPPEGGVLFVETRGIDVPSKDRGCSGSICIFKLFFRLYI
jgi:hypothetical protein